MECSAHPLQSPLNGDGGLNNMDLCCEESVYSLGRRSHFLKSF